MFNDELITLMTIEEVRTLTQKPVSQAKGIADNHIGSLRDSLVIEHAIWLMISAALLKSAKEE